MREEVCVCINVQRKRAVELPRTKKEQNTTIVL